MKRKSNLIIRVQRNIGFSKKPIFSVVVMNKSKRPAGRFFEKVGFIGYSGKKSICFFNVSRLSYWLLMGADLSWRVKRLLAILFTHEHFYKTVLNNDVSLAPLWAIIKS